MDPTTVKKMRLRSRMIFSSSPIVKRRSRRVARVVAKKSQKQGTCTPTDHKVSAFPKVWSEFRLRNLFCDGNIRSNDKQEYQINRAILAAVSPYFKILFTNRWQRGKKDDRVLDVDLTGNILDLMLDFAYTGYCEVNRDNVQRLLPAADQFEFQGIVLLCCDFLVKELTPENCIGIMQFGKTYFLTDLVKCAMKFIRQHFEAVFAGDQICSLTVDELFGILSHDELNSRCEEVVFEAILEWMEFDAASREAYLPKLAQCVRFGLLDYTFFSETVLGNPYVKRCPGMLDTLKPVVVMLRDGDDLDLSLPVARPRVPYEVVFTMGGWREGAPTRVVETYDTRANRWFFSSAEVPVECAYHGLCALENLIYMVGGMDGHDFYNTVRSYDPVKRTWTQRSCMHQARSYVSVVALNGHMFAIGGYNGRQRLSSAEKYSPSQNQWYLIASMSCRRSDACAAVLHDKIYIVGGFTGDEVLKTAETYDPQTDQWSLIPSMLSARSGVGLVAYHEALYAMGGFDGLTRLYTVERLDPESDPEWHGVTDMYSPRSNFASVVLDDMIFVVGGFDGATTTTQVECYDETTREWYGAACLTLNRSALGACVVHGLPNVREYSLASYFPDVGEDN